MAEARNKPSHIQSNDFSTRVLRPFNEERTAFSTKSSEGNGYLPALE